MNSKNNNKMAKRFQSQRRNYLNISAKGYLYKKSDKEAYEKAVAEGKDHIRESKSNDGSVYYHDVYSSTEDGYIDFLGINKVEINNDGKKSIFKSLIISIDGGKESDVVSVPLFYSNGSLTRAAKNIILTLPGIDFSEKLNISCSSMKNDKGYENLYIFFNRVDKKGTEDSFVKSPLKYGEDIPSAETKVGIDGSETKSFEKQDAFIYNILVEQIERFKKFKGINETPEKEDTPKEVKNTPKSTSVATPSEAFDIPVDEENDDLPF